MFVCLLLYKQACLGSLALGLGGLWSRGVGHDPTLPPGVSALPAVLGVVWLHRGFHPLPRAGMGLWGSFLGSCGGVPSPMEGFLCLLCRAELASLPVMHSWEWGDQIPVSPFCTLCPTQWYVIINKYKTKPTQTKVLL